MVYKVYIDASYVINGLAPRSRWCSQGSNGDIWTQIFDTIENIEVIPIKGKSHIETQEQWEKHRVTPEALILNEIADAAADEASEYFSKNKKNILADCIVRKDAMLRAMWLARVQAACWLQDTREAKHTTQIHKFIEATVNEAKRKIDDAINNTEGGRNHEVFYDGKWVRCRDCPGKAKPGNVKYWTKTPCSKLCNNKQSGRPGAGGIKLRRRTKTDGLRQMWFYYQSTPRVSYVLHYTVSQLYQHILPAVWKGLLRGLQRQPPMQKKES